MSYKWRYEDVVRAHFHAASHIRIWLAALGAAVSGFDLIFHAIAFPLDTDSIGVVQYPVEDG
jgi:hypothetical protein